MSILRGLIDIILPRYCAVCDSEMTAGEDCLCNACLFKLDMIRWDSIDDNPLLRQLWDKAEVEAGGCSLYYKHDSSSHNIFVLTKYRGRPDVGRTVVSKAFGYWMEKGLVEGVDCIMPVPLHWKRRLVRGYNQADWIARGVADATKIPIESGVLRRIRNNRTQTHKSGLQRESDSENLFVAKPGKGLDGKTVLLVDDIVTTGSTIGDCIRALRQQYPTVKVRVYSLGWSGN